MSQAKRNETDTEVTPHFVHRNKVIKEDNERKEKTKVVEEYYELISDHQHRRGAKVRHCFKTNSGNLHRIYLGRYKDLKDHLDRLQKEGKKIVR